MIGSTLYVAITERDAQTDAGSGLLDFREFCEGRVIAIDLDTLAVTNFVKPRT